MFEVSPGKTFQHHWTDTDILNLEASDKVPVCDISKLVERGRIKRQSNDTCVLHAHYIY